MIPATEMSAGTSVMPSSRWPLTGSRQSGHRQLKRSQTAGRPAALAPSRASAAPPDASGSSGLSGPPGASGPAGLTLAGRLVIGAPFMIVHCRDSLQSGLPERPCQRGAPSIRGSSQTSDNRRSPGPKISATRPYASGCITRIVGTLGIMATRVAKGTPRPGADAPGGQGRPAAGQSRAQGGQGRGAGGQARTAGSSGRPASGRASTSKNAMPAPTRQGQSRGGPSRSGRKRPAQNRSGRNRSGQNRSGQGRKRPASKGRPRGTAARPPQRTADPILILAGWLARLVAGLWMVAAHAVGFGARRFGKSARDLDPLHQRDGLGLAFLAAALVVAATTWFHLHNFAGRMLSDLFLGAFGSAAWTVPLLLGLLAWRFLRHPDRNAQTGRMVIGWSCLLLGGLGLVHIAAGTPQPAAGEAAMRSGAGLIGFFVSAPLVAVLTPWIAAPLLALISGFGLLVITGTPVHRVPDRLAELRDFAQRTGDTGLDEDETAGEIEGTATTGPLPRGGRKRPPAIEAGRPSPALRHAHPR